MLEAIGRAKIRNFAPSSEPQDSETCLFIDVQKGVRRLQ